MGQLLRQGNTTTLTMIPKSNRAQVVAEFRPIACCSIIYKVISKVLSHRLAPVLERIVDKAQCDFVKSRLIYRIICTWRNNSFVNMNGKMCPTYVYLRLIYGKPTTQWIGDYVGGFRSV